MNIKTAKKKLAKIAKGKFHSVQYDITDIGNGELKQECSIYISGMSWHLGETWEEAFSSLQKATAKPKTVVIESIEEVVPRKSKAKK